jgi:hypothetical protein
VRSVLTNVHMQSRMLVIGLASRPASRKLPPARWLSAHPGKRWTEVFFLAYSPFWIGAMAVIVATEAYEVRGPT